METSWNFESNSMILDKSTQLGNAMDYLDLFLLFLMCISIVFCLVILSLPLFKNNDIFFMVNAYPTLFLALFFCNFSFLGINHFTKSFFSSFSDKLFLFYFIPNIICFSPILYILFDILGNDIITYCLSFKFTIKRVLLSHFFLTFPVFIEY